MKTSVFPMWLRERVSYFNVFALVGLLLMLMIVSGCTPPQASTANNYAAEACTGVKIGEAVDPAFAAHNPKLVATANAACAVAPTVISATVTPASMATQTVTTK